MNRIGTDLLKQSKACHEDNKLSGRKDVLSLLVKANTLEDPQGRMTDEDVLDRVYKLILDRCIYSTVFIEIPTFIIAGHETTRYTYISVSLNVRKVQHVLNLGHSVAMTWALYALTQNKQAQTKLREEVSNVSTDNPTMDDLNGLPYLDAVVRETMRRYSPISVVSRAADKDDFIPLSKPFTDRKGNVRHELRFVFLTQILSS